MAHPTAPGFRSRLGFLFHGTTRIPGRETTSGSLRPAQQVEALNEHHVQLLMNGEGDGEGWDNGKPHFQSQIGPHKTNFSAITGSGSQPGVDRLRRVQRAPPQWGVASQSLLKELLERSAHDAGIANAKDCRHLDLPAWLLATI